jgi:hypothetical protein
LYDLTVKVLTPPLKTDCVATAAFDNKNNKLNGFNLLVDNSDYKQRWKDCKSAANVHL